MNAFVRLDSTWIEDKMYVTIDGDRLDTAFFGDTILSCDAAPINEKLYSLSHGRHELKVFDSTDLNRVWAIFRYTGDRIRVSGYSSIIDSTEMTAVKSDNCLAIRIAREEK